MARLAQPITLRLRKADPQVFSVPASAQPAVPIRLLGYCFDTQ